jgi:NAD(P)-dependent dehydrogenase (short-subunit alcohol dehydrogenase family)
MEKQRFAGKVALVTGATSGIGQATAVRLAADGAVVAVNRRPEGDASTTLRMISDAGGSAFAVTADMREPAAVLSMVDTVVKSAGRIDYLVSNAAINPLLAWDETTLEDYDRIQETNLRGTWLVAQAAAKAMIAAGTPGAIVAVSSISAWVGAAEQVAYCGTKAGISMLMKALAIVLGPHGIRCNAVLPGAILTPMSKELLDPASPARQYYLDRTPLHRIGEPREVADAIAFLLSDEASYITSSELLVDGGFIVNAE